MKQKKSNKEKKERKKREQQIRLEIQNRRNRFIKSIDCSIHNYPQIEDWDISPTPPFKVDTIEVSRCFYLSIIIKDINNVKYTFSFDLEDRLVYAGELFYSYETIGFSENRFAYIKVNSKLEREVFPAIENAINNELNQYGKERYPLRKLEECLQRAKIHTKHWR